MIKKCLTLIMVTVLIFTVSGCGIGTSKTAECPVCAHENEPDVNYCVKCGASLNSIVGGGEEINESKICPSCSCENAASAKFCGQCGTPLENTPNNDDNVNDNDNNANSGNENIDTDVETENICGSITLGSDIYDAYCSICAYDGYDKCQGHDCVSCSGLGYKKCYGCQNGMTPYGDCVICNGGKIDCLCEDGTMYYDAHINVSPKEEYELCDKCEAGYVQCSLCEGTGRYGSYEVGGYNGNDGVEVDKLCTQCLGLKKTKCTKCGGDGRVTK